MTTAMNPRTLLKKCLFQNFPMGNIHESIENNKKEESYFVFLQQLCFLYQNKMKLDCWLIGLKTKTKMFDLKCFQTHLRRHSDFWIITHFLSELSLEVFTCFCLSISFFFCISWNCIWEYQNEPKITVRIPIKF